MRSLQPCVANLDIAMINKFYDLATMQPKVPATVQSHYELLEHKASECIGCHACESRCPFGVPIAERMEKTAKLIRLLNKEQGDKHMEHLRCVVERITYQNEENGYTVLKCAVKNYSDW